MAELLRERVDVLLQESRNFLDDFWAGFACLLMNKVDHLVKLTAGLLHLCIVKFLCAPDRANLVNDSRPAVVHALGCHGKTGLAAS